MSMKLKLNVGYLLDLGRVLLFAVTIGFCAEVMAQSNVFSGTVGVMAFEFSPPPPSSAWRTNAKVKDGIATIMRREGIALPPQFAFENTKTGAILWGTFSPFPEDFTVDAFEQYLEEPFFPKVWGIQPHQITSGVSANRDYSWLRVNGQGDGKTFSSDIKSVKMQGVFSLLPVQYDTGSTVKSGAIFIDYRGPELGNPYEGELIVKSLIDSLRPSTGITLLSSSAFKQKYTQLSQKEREKVQSGDGQLQLPTCQGGVGIQLSNCFGILDLKGGDRYIGEFKGDRYSGQGTYYFADGRIGLGDWLEGKPNGLFIEFRANKTIQQSGIYKDGNLVGPSQYVDPKRFTRIPGISTFLTANEAQQQEALALQSNKRVALVMGNASYTKRPLKNSLNDADDISRALKSANFDVIDLRDATLPQMRSAVRQFGDKLLKNDVGLVYYSGHGMEVKGRNYLLPVNADIQRDDEIADQGLDMALILEKMTTAGKGVNILIVDACRDDPFGRSFRSSSKGLATMDAPRGTIIAYSTSPGKVASDGDPKARNSPYTKALLQAMQVPNRPIEQVFKDVRRSVQAETKDQQTPWENTSLSGDFYFRVQK